MAELTVVDDRAIGSVGASNTIVGNVNVAIIIDGHGTDEVVSTLRGLGECERLLGFHLALALGRRSGRSRNGSGDHEAEDNLAEEMHRSSLVRADESCEGVESRKD